MDPSPTCRSIPPPKVDRFPDQIFGTRGHSWGNAIDFDAILNFFKPQRIVEIHRLNERKDIMVAIAALSENPEKEVDLGGGLNSQAETIIQSISPWKL